MEDTLLYQFGRFIMDDENWVLSKGRMRIHLAPKAFEILSLLVSRRGRTIAKTEFLDNIWPDACVEEANITQHIAVLRKALGDSPKTHEARYIETVSRRGYRFVARVRAIPRPEYRIVVGKTAHD